ncbi:MAG: TonB family protein [Pseudomonadota bacterium]
MRANLRLVESSLLFPQAETSAANQSADFMLRNPVVEMRIPKRQHNAIKSATSRPSLIMLSIVILVHVTGLAWLISTKQSQPDISQALTPITVSLVSAAEEKPAMAPLLSAKPLQVVKEKTMAKPNKPTPEPAVTKSFVTQTADESEAQPSLPEPAIVASTPKTIETSQQKVEHEPAIEPPRFGVAYLNNPAPDYPPLARRLGEQGRVLLRVLVSTNGEADHVQVESSSGSKKLDQAAMLAVKQWNFVPAKRSNLPISAYVLVPVNFSLEG